MTERTDEDESGEIDWWEEAHGYAWEEGQYGGTSIRYSITRISFKYVGFVIKMTMHVDDYVFGKRQIHRYISEPNWYEFNAAGYTYGHMFSLGETEDDMEYFAKLLKFVEDAGDPANIMWD